MKSRCSRGTACQLFKFPQKDPRARRLQPPLSVESLEYRKPHDLLQLEVVLGLCAAGNESPAILSPLLVQDVVTRPLLRVSQDRVGFKE